jgi:aspartyl protease family protein
MIPQAHLDLMLSSDDTARILYLGLILASLAGWIMVEYRKRMGQALRTALAWGLIFLGLMAGYGLWGDIRRDILPRQAVQGGQIVIPLGADGHYHPSLTINGQTVDFIADTGASNVVLTQQDAKRLGIDPGSLAYMGQATTANGIVRTASVKITDVTFGPYHDDAILASVNDGQMDTSLLGMDYLGRFTITMAGDQMILTR